MSLKTLEAPKTLDTRPLQRPQGFVPLSALGKTSGESVSKFHDKGETLSEIDKVLARFEREERARLGLDVERGQYREQTFHGPKSAKKAHTTILISGLTLAQDLLVSGALKMQRFLAMRPRPRTSPSSRA
jgi:hypothetical protein